MLHAIWESDNLSQTAVEIIQLATQITGYPPYLLIR